MTTAAAESSKASERASDARDTVFRSRHALFLLAVTVVGSMLYLGGAGTYAVPAAATIALLAAVVTGVTPRTIGRDRMAWIFLLITGVTVIQLVPLPPFLLRLIDSRSAEISGAALYGYRVDLASHWRSLHLDPGSGITDLHYFVGLAAAYLAARQVSIRGHGGTLVEIALWSTLTLALTALAHKLWTVDAVYGVYRPIAATPPIVSPILNPNHLAAVVGVGAVLWTGEALAAQDAATRLFKAVAATSCGAVAVLSLSRGGVIASLGGIVLLVALSRARAKRRSHSANTFAIAIVASAVVAISFWVASEAIRAEYATNDSTKLALMFGALRGLRGHYVLGAGSGGLATAISSGAVISGRYSMFRAECLPVDLAVAFGPLVGLVILGLGARWFWHVRPSFKESEPRELAVYAAILSLGLHDLFDFALWFGAAGYLGVTLAGFLAGTRSQRGVPIGTKRSRATRWPLIMLAMLSLGASRWTGHLDLDSHRHDAGAALASRGSIDFRPLLRLHPGDAPLQLEAGALAAWHRDPNALRFVNRAMALSPGWAEPHRVLARFLFGRGLRSQALLETRSAARLDDQLATSLAQMLVETNVSVDEARAALPERGAARVTLATAIGANSANSARAAEMDNLVLEVVPNHLPTLLRGVERARVSNDRATRLSLLERVIAAYPDHPDGYLGVATVHREAGELDEAERALNRGLAHVQGHEGFQVELARLRAARGDAAAVRAIIAELLDHVGANIDQRIQINGLWGDLESQMGHQARALTAYERADVLAFPQHPYITRIIELSSALNDVARLRAACGSLQDQRSLTSAETRLCDAASRAPGFNLAPPTTDDQ